MTQYPLVYLPPIICMFLGSLLFELGASACDLNHSQLYQQCYLVLLCLHTVEKEFLPQNLVIV